ncbi:MAG: TlpA family protein disulfide reductase [Bacteroidales bacterium]|jgi:peroxiredoxin|nr:TlpA family protein disulfide reductase [Bacteroidales bacterium]
MKFQYLLFAVSFWAFTSCISDKDDKDTKNDVRIDDHIPVFEIKNEERSLKSPDDFQGKKTLLVFFTTTCSDCRREMPFAEYAYRQLGSQGLNVVTIGRGETREAVDDFWKKLDLSMPYFLDSDRKVFDLFASQTIPRLYLVNENGIVVWMLVNDFGYGSFTQEKGDLFNKSVREKLNL